MVGFNRIMALVDFSITSLHAAEEAAMIASKFNGELHLLHVAPDSTAAYLAAPEAYFFEVAEDDKQNEIHNKKSLGKIKEDLEQRFEVNIEIHEITGKLYKTVTDLSHALRIELLVLGATKKSWFRELFFENKVKNIMRSVDCEVLCVYRESNSIRLKKMLHPSNKIVQLRDMGQYVISNQ